MKLVNTAQMRAIDAKAINERGIPALTLMEKAGASVSELITKKFKTGSVVAVIAGKGNNAGDGFVCARLLSKKKFKVKVFVLADWRDFAPDARTNWEKLAGTNVKAFEALSEKGLAEFASEFKDVDVMVDAIFGTGLENTVSSKFKAAIEFVNGLRKPVVAVDIPSGLSADSGSPLGAAIKAKFTVSLGLCKLGLCVGDGPEYAGEVIVADIGFPKDIIEEAKSGFFETEPSDLNECFTPRPKDSHKGDFGHVLVVGGSFGKMGAGSLSSRGALRSGAGLVTYALPEKAFSRFDPKSAEVMLEPLADDKKGFLTKQAPAILRELLQKKNVMAIGPGIGTEKETVIAFFEFLSAAHIPVVIDADGLNCLATNTKVLLARRHPTVLTPHPGEMSRLCGATIEDIGSDRVAYAREFAEKFGVYLVLKGNRSVIAMPDGDIYVNPTGNAGMATAGMGDVLTGIIAGFIAQGIDVGKSVIAGVYLHGLAGDMVRDELGDRGLIASDIINALPKAIKSLS